MTLEIAVFNLYSALLAMQAGAHRIELCENAHEGGTTPSYGVLVTARKKISIPLFAMIRPRGGDFLYSNEEFESMVGDVDVCKQLGYDGVVLGLLKDNGDIDEKRTALLCNRAYPMEVTFHRAFDRARYPTVAIQQIINCGCSRILTSGQKPTVEEGKENIKEWLLAFKDDIIFLPGSGVRSNNIHQLMNELGVSEMHSSARKIMPSLMQWNVPSMKEELMTTSVDEAEIKNMLQQLSM